jgi:hypothetical protein
VACAERQQFYEATLHAMFKRGSLSVPPLDITEDVRIPLAICMHTDRVAVLRLNSMQRQQKTLYHEKVSIFIGTWNMGAHCLHPVTSRSLKLERLSW